MNYRSLLILATCICCGNATGDDQVHVLNHEQPDLVVDLHVGLWAYPLPCDFDKDGDNDLLVC